MREKTFKFVALERHSNKKKWSQGTVDRVFARLNRHVSPAVGYLPVTEPRSYHFIELLKGVEEEGLLEITSRSRQRLSNIIRYAVHQGLIEINPAANLDGVAASPARQHYPTLSLERLPEPLERADSYHQGRELTRFVVLLTLHMFIRSSGLYYARWTEVNFRNRIWAMPTTCEAIVGVRYSSRGAKMCTPYIVPFSEQVVSIPKRIKEISDRYELVFPGCRDPYKPTSENIINKALRQMGYNTKQDIYGHGFRVVACSALMEPGLWSQDAVERQMSHQGRNAMHLAYIYKTEHMEARIDMMQRWLDHLDMCSEIWVPPYIWSQQDINFAIA